MEKEPPRARAFGVVTGRSKHIPEHSVTFSIMSSWNFRKTFISASSTLKKIGTSKRQKKNDDDPNDDDYNPDPSELVVASSVGGNGDDTDMEEGDGSDEDEILDVHTLDFHGRN